MISFSKYIRDIGTNNTMGVQKENWNCKGTIDKLKSTYMAK